MQTERIEERWIAAFVRVFQLCEVAAGEVCAILSETRSRPVIAQLAELALLRLGARPFHVAIVSPVQTVPSSARSNGGADAARLPQPVMDALAACGFVADCTVKGLLHTAELPAILQGGARVLTISGEHPDALARLVPDPVMETAVREGTELLKNTRRMQVTSDAGTQLVVTLAGARAAGDWGFATRPGTVAHWPGGSCLCFPAKATINGLLVLAPGDVNLTFRRHIESKVTMLIQNDFVTDISGHNLDASLMRRHVAALGDRGAYAVSHVGWGMNPAASRDSMALHDPRDFNGTELRAVAGNFLCSAGPAEASGSPAPGQVDLPLAGCTVALDDHVVVEDGMLQLGRTRQD